MLKTYEQKIFELISDCLLKSETIVFDRYFIYRLPQGAKKLGWGKNTAIEILYRLAYDSISNLKYKYDKAMPSNLIVIATGIDEDEIPARVGGDTPQGRPIRIIGYRGLLKQIENACGPIVEENSENEEYRKKFINKLKKDIKKIKSVYLWEQVLVNLLALLIGMVY